MGWSALFSIKFCLFLYLITFAYGDDTPRGPKRTNKSPYVGITPFIRTGRANYPRFPYLEDMVEENELKKLLKTYLTPWSVNRVSIPNWLQQDALDGIEKRSGSSDSDLNKGLWFGPRLGRIQKRQESKSNFPTHYVYLGGDFIPRLGREQEELPETESLENTANDKIILEN